MQTMRDCELFDWLDDPRRDAGMRIVDDDGVETVLPYADLGTQARSMGAAVDEACLGRRGPVALALSDARQFAAAFFGCLLVGRPPVPIAPFSLTGPERYAEDVRGILRAARPAAVVIDETATLVGEAAAGARPVVQADALHGDCDLVEARPRTDDIALIQFTSGSTGHPRGVPVLRRNLEANLNAIRRTFDMRPTSGVASWLPLHHDMGLIGCLLTPITTGADVWLMRPDQFIRNPALWLRCFDRGRAVITASPTFGFAYATRRVAEGAVDDVDLSGWRTAIIGAERVDARTLQRFAGRFSAQGFRPSAFKPAYGMAEATLAISGWRATEPPRTVGVDLANASIGEPVPVVRMADVGPAHGNDGHLESDGLGWLVSCGPPLDGMEVEARDDDGRPLPSGHLGILHVAGPSVPAAYVADATSTSTSFTSNGVLTGDAGFLLDGEVFVLGRLGDALKVRGRSVFAEDLETQVDEVLGRGRGRSLAIVALGERGEPTLHVVLEVEPDAVGERVLAVIDAVAGRETPRRVFVGRRGTILRTTSGKPCRSAMGAALARGELAVTEVEPGPSVLASVKACDRPSVACGPDAERGTA
jgi:fatty-acyl-CoA synthase